MTLSLSALSCNALSTIGATDPQFGERFEREAKTLSHLNHRQVRALYDLGHDAGTAFMVMG